jgi:glutathione synthase/RimK-type ligase-like ATP-grasp enzyme
MTGASGYSVELVARGRIGESVSRLAAEARTGGVMVQEFLPEIAEGELSLVYFDGIFSHAVRKRPPQGEFRVNSRFGATRNAETPSRAVTEQGAAALRALPELPLYARVDGIVRANVLIMIEVEVLEPALFMEFDPLAAERFAEATVRRLRGAI